MRSLYLEKTGCVFLGEMGPSYYHYSHDTKPCGLRPFGFAHAESQEDVGDSAELC